MRLLTLRRLATLFAVTQAVIAFALQTYANTTAGSSVQSYAGIEKRVNSQLTVPLNPIGLETWQGDKVYLGMFGTGLRNDEVRAAAKQTFESLTGRLPSTLLVSVMFVPGRGLVAGTIWRAGNPYFEAPAQANAPRFWNAVPGIL
jgi:hypothetical protein